MDSHDKDKEAAAVARNRTFWMALRNSVHGIVIVLLRERNMRIHIFCSLLILIAGLFFGLRRMDWLWVTIGVFLVIYAEFLNTIIESVVDLIVEKEYNVLAGLTKDVAAGMVLVAVGVEIVILFLIFQPYIWHYFGIVTNFSDFIHQFKG